MKSSQVFHRAVVLFGVVSLWILCFAGCQYDVPITSSPTRNLDQRLLGDWRSLDGKEDLRVRRLDDSTYVAYYDGDLFRAYHSDIGETPFATVQDLNSGDRKYAYVIWKLSDDGRNLRLRNVTRQGCPKGKQGLSHCSCAPDKKRHQS